MANENDLLELQVNDLDFDYEELLQLESSLESNLKDVIEHIDQLDIDREKLQNNEYLQESIENIVWEQVQLQVAAQIGEEFIKENKGQTLDLRKEAHIQTAENFEKGIIATHNRTVDHQKIYNEWQDSFILNKNGERILKKETREFFDKGRDKGSSSVHKDHTISIKEQLNDIDLVAFSTKDEIKVFANSSKNLHDLDASANMSKGDKPMLEFLNTERNGLKPEERFNIDRRQAEFDEKEAREGYSEFKDNAKKRAVESGKKSRRDEGLKVSGKALKVAIFQLLSEFLKEIIKKFIVWLGEKHKNLNSFLEKLKEAVSTFVSNLSKHILNVGKSILTMLVTSIFGTFGEVFLKIWTFMKQGWSSLKDAIDYLNNPENSSKDINIIILELGKIITAGIIVTGGLVLGETIGKSLVAIAPPLSVEIPILGSLASIIGTFMGATLSGIIGAFVLKMIDQQIVNKQISELSSKKIDQNNEMLVIQDQLLDVKSTKLQVEKDSIVNTIKERHDMAASMMKEKLSDIFEESTRDDKSDFDEIDSLLQELLD